MRQKQCKHRREHFPASWFPIKSVRFIKQNKKTNDVPLRLSCLAKITGHSLTRINQSRLTERKKEATVHWLFREDFFFHTLNMSRKLLSHGCRVCHVLSEDLSVVLTTTSLLEELLVISLERIASFRDACICIINKNQPQEYYWTSKRHTKINPTGFPH